ncbi:MAG: hypothetical protein JO217_01330 [Acidobacteriaceae bacterium]|nr:hypothetical protein [Acidobacteriaceae bacterium]MBV9441313.1 hypothetical protein [Acidobacteriaceae bacterium]
MSCGRQRRADPDRRDGADDEGNIDLSYTWVKTALQTAGLVKRWKKPGSHRKRRPRRPLPGMMLHIDGNEDAGPGMSVITS